MPHPRSPNVAHRATCRSHPSRRRPELARLVLALAALSWTSWACADICRVTESGTDLGDGSDWGAQALALQAALAAPACTEIWVKAGVYKATTGTDVNISFNIRPGAAVYGGFDGSEAELAARDPVLNATILSGDIDDNDIDEDGNHIADHYQDVEGANTRRLILMDGTTAAGPITASTVLDGFVVTAGHYADVAFDELGAGLYCDGSGIGHECSPTLRQLRFIGNRAFSGGAMYNLGSSGGISSPALDDVAFVSNYAEQFGGGMVNASSDGGVSNPTLTHVVFRDNVSSHFGGAMFNITSAGSASPVLTNVTFSGNTASALGGAISNSSAGESGSASPSLTNVTFSANVADSGAAIYGSSNVGAETSPTLVNVTFTGNHANGSGGAFSIYPRGGTSQPTFRNVILWGDSAEDNGQEIFYSMLDGGTLMPVMDFSIVQGGDAGSFRSDGIPDTTFSDGIGNLDADPLLGALGDNGGATPTLLPATGSAAIDTGTNTGCPVTDQRGVARPQGPTCDIGAVEVQPDVIFADGFEQG